MPVQAFTGGCATGITASGNAYARRQPEMTALYQVFHRHLPGFERGWKDADNGNCVPKHVTRELQQFQIWGILANGYAQLKCDDCNKWHLVAFSCSRRCICRPRRRVRRRGRNRSRPRLNRWNSSGADRVKARIGGSIRTDWVFGSLTLWVKGELCLGVNGAAI